MIESYVWVVMKNADTNEGRGPMVLDSIWAAGAEVECRAYVNSRPGVQGRRCEWTKDAYGDWTMTRHELHSSLQEIVKAERAALRRGALAKLTPQEREALGLGEVTS